MNFVNLEDLPNDCSAPHQEAAPIAASKERQHHLDDWLTREGTRHEGYGIVMVHADGDDPFYGPHLGNEEERQARTTWVHHTIIRAQNGLGLGREALNPALHPTAVMFAKLPELLVRQQDVMQCLRGPGYTNRFDHGLDSGLIAGRIAVRAGLPANLVELATFTGLMHDVGHYGFAHSAERAIHNTLLRHGFADGHEVWDHADNSGRVISSMLQNPGEFEIPGNVRDALSFQDLVHGVSNHSWHLRHGRSDYSRPSSQFGSIAADLAGASDRVSYSITDTLDAIRSGRMRWEDVGQLFPKALAFAKFDKGGIQKLILMGPDTGGQVFQAAMRTAFIDNFGDTIRNTGIVGLNFEAADALRELRSTAKDYLFGLSDHKKWEEKQAHFCEVVLGSLVEDAEREGFTDNAAYEAVRRFGALTETEVIRTAIERNLKIDFDIADLESAPDLGARTMRRAPRVRRLPSRRLEPLSEVLGHVYFLDATDGTKVDLRAEEAMNLFHVLNAKGNVPLSLKIRDRNEVNAQIHTFTLPETRQEKEELFAKLEAAVEKALGLALLAHKRNTEKGVHAHSLRFLANLYYNRDSRPPAALKAYSEAFHETLAVSTRAETLGPTLSLASSQQLN